MARLDRAALEAGLKRLDAQHLTRRRRVVQGIAEPGNPTRVWVEGRRLRNFCSNDYLGLSAHPALVDAASRCLQRLPFGAGAAHLISGHSSEHQALEQELADFTGRERALLFSTGYMANVGVISALLGRHDLLLADRLSHASLLDGARLCGAELKRYAHADANALEQRLVQGSGKRSLMVVTDGVFSMDGDLAPLQRVAELAARHRAWLLVDDAHGLGVLGARGGGSLELSGLTASAVPLLMGTLGKAFGSFGAFVAGDAAVIEYLTQHARSYIYTTALPPPIAAATRRALQLAMAEPERRTRLHTLVRRLRDHAAEVGLPLASSATPIQPLIVGDAARALALSAALMERGFWVAAIRPPTVPEDSARLRITLSAAHTEDDVDALVETLAQLWCCHGSAPASAAPALSEAVDGRPS